MTHEHKFLVTYGLHNFVSHSRVGEKPIFTIHRHDNLKMVGHAKSLITESYGVGACIMDD